MVLFVLESITKLHITCVLHFFRATNLDEVPPIRRKNENLQRQGHAVGNYDIDIRVRVYYMFYVLVLYTVNLEYFRE